MIKIISGAFKLFIFICIVYFEFGCTNISGQKKIKINFDTSNFVFKENVFDTSGNLYSTQYFYKYDSNLIQVRNWWAKNNEMSNAYFLKKSTFEPIGPFLLRDSMGNLMSETFFLEGEEVGPEIIYVGNQIKFLTIHFPDAIFEIDTTRISVLNSMLRAYLKLSGAENLKYANTKINELKLSVIQRESDTTQAFKVTYSADKKDSNTFLVNYHWAEKGRHINLYLRNIYQSESEIKHENSRRYSYSGFYLNERDDSVSVLYDRTDNSVNALLK